MQIQNLVAPTRTRKHSTLHGIVSELINDTAPLAVHNRNFVINNVPADLKLETNGLIVSSVLSKLFKTIVRHTQNSGILVSAKVYGMVVLVQVRSNGHVSPALPGDIDTACQNAQSTGGIVELVHYENKAASVAYCFLNIAGAA